MGGCASRPKEFDNKPEDSAPAEAPASPKKAEAEIASQEKKDGGEEQHKEAPLVDLSEEPQMEAAEGTTEEEKTEAAAATTTTTFGGVEEKKVEEAVAAEKKVEGEATMPSSWTPADAEDSSNKDKSDAPLVTI